MSGFSRLSHDAPGEHLGHRLPLIGGQPLQVAVAGLAQPAARSQPGHAWASGWHRLGRQLRLGQLAAGGADGHDLDAGPGDRLADRQQPAVTLTEAEPLRILHARGSQQGNRLPHLAAGIVERRQ